MATIDLEIFALAEDVTDDQFIAIDEAYLEWSYISRPGLLRRTTAREESVWAIVTWWATKAGESPLEDPTTPRDWRDSINAESYRRRTFRTLD